jgi:hypothetical protein
MKILTFVAVFLFAVLLAPLASADTVTIDFENLSDSTVIGSNYASLGVVFSGAAIATAGFSLNDADFPPHSGTNVAIDALGPITLSFSTPISSLSGYFTYAHALTLTGFDAANHTVGTASSLLAANYGSSGNTPNELIHQNFGSGVTTVTIVGNPGGGSFALDDLSFTQTVVTSAPEPTTSSLLLLALAGGIFVRKLTIFRI